ncbi:unnamed protein product, partial [Pylaiella littoralis]
GCVILCIPGDKSMVCQKRPKLSPGCRILWGVCYLMSGGLSCVTYGTLVVLLLRRVHNIADVFDSVCRDLKETPLVVHTDVSAYVRGLSAIFPSAASGVSRSARIHFFVSHVRQKGNACPFVYKYRHSEYFQHTL